MIFSRGHDTERGIFQETSQQDGEQTDRNPNRNQTENATYQAGMQKDINYPTLPRQEPSAPHQEPQNKAPAIAPKPDLLTIWHKLREERDTFPKTIREEPENSTREKEVVAQIQQWSVEMKRRRSPQTETFKIQIKPRAEGNSDEEE